MAIQRYRLQDTFPTTFPGSAYTAKRFLDALEDPSNPTYQYTITDESITIPASGDDLLRVELDYVPDGDPTNATVFVVNTLQSAAGTAFTGTTSQDDLSTYQVRVEPGRPFIYFNRSALAAAGFTTVYATYKTYTSVYTANWGSRVEKFMAEMSAWGVTQSAAGSQNITETSIATGPVGGLLADSLVYAYLDGGTLKWDYADASDSDKLPDGYLASNSAVGEYPTVLLAGKVTTLALNPQVRKQIWASPVEGQYTWESDTSGNILTAGDFVCNLGKAISSTTAYINCLNYPVYQKEA